MQAHNGTFLCSPIQSISIKNKTSSFRKQEQTQDAKVIFFFFLMDIPLASTKLPIRMLLRFRYKTMNKE